MKIALIGTHGTGKTTLLYSLAAELKKKGIDVGMVSETARKCPLPINRNTSFDAQLWIMTAQISKELETLKKYGHVICDRSVLDAYVYALVAGCSHRIMEKIADTWIGSYDVLFKLPIIYPLQADKTRPADKKFQEDIDEVMDIVLKEKKIKFFNVPEENQEKFIISKLRFD